jgi:hypothetical protein
MKLSALKKRAKADGVAQASLREADDADDIKSTVIELIVAAAEPRAAPQREQTKAKEPRKKAKVEAKVGAHAPVQTIELTLDNYDETVVDSKGVWMVLFTSSEECKLIIV